MAGLEQDNAKGQRVSLIGLMVNVSLAIVKLLAGVLGNSYALIADAVESMADIFGSVIVWHGLKVASQPPDDDHPYGHGKAETLAGLIVGFMLVGAGLGIAVEAIRELRTPGASPEPYTLFVLIGVVLVKEIMFRVAKTTAVELESSAINADAWHHRSDAITSTAAAIGIGIALIGGKEYSQADEWAALFASAIILFNAYRLIRPSMNELMDVEPTALIEKVRMIAGNVQDVVEVEKIFARKSGMHYWVDMHVEVDPEMPVKKAHEVAHNVQDAIRNAVPTVAGVLIHIEPAPSED